MADTGQEERTKEDGNEKKEEGRHGDWETNDDYRQQSSLIKHCDLLNYQRHNE